MSRVKSHIGKLDADINKACNSDMSKQTVFPKTALGRKIAQALKRKGGCREFAVACGIEPATVTMWRVRERVPPEFCHLFEKVSEGRVKASELRPDLFDPSKRAP